MGDIVEVAYSFPDWAEVPSFDVLLKADVTGSLSPRPVVVFRLATVRDSEHADDVSRGGLPDVLNVQALSPEQALAFGEMLVRAANQALGR